MGTCTSSPSQATTQTQRCNPNPCQQCNLSGRVSPSCIGRPSARCYNLCNWICESLTLNCTRTHLEFINSSCTVGTAYDLICPPIHRLHHALNYHGLQCCPLTASTAFQCRMTRDWALPIVGSFGDIPTSQRHFVTTQRLWNTCVVQRQESWNKTKADYTRRGGVSITTTDMNVFCLTACNSQVAMKV